MQYTHPLDRFMVRIRPLLIGAAVLSLPVMLISYGWMMKQLFTTAPGWVSVAVLISHLIVWLGISALIDMRSEQGPR